jgi:molecular chaperone DnaK
VRVRAASGLSEMEVERLIGEAENYRSTDLEKQAVAHLANKADGLIYTTERSLQEFSSYLTDDEAEQIKKDISKCREASASFDKDALDHAIADLEKSAYRIADVMYQDVS